MMIASNESESNPSKGTAPRFVLLHEEARRRGFKNALCFRRWCRRRGVTIRADGRKQWVAPVEIDQAIDAFSTEAVASPNEATTALDPVASGVLDLMMQSGRRR